LTDYQRFPIISPIFKRMHRPDWEAKVNPKHLVHLIVLAVIAGCKSELIAPTTTNPPNLGLILADDGAIGQRFVAFKLFGIVWTSVAQSFTAEDRRVSTAFRMFDASGSNGGTPLVYNLYAGENSYNTLIASRTIGLPSSPASDARNAIDVGYADAAFTDVVLVVGQKYTIELTVPPANQPPTDGYTPYGVFESSANPYAAGRFFFTPGASLEPANPSFGDEDLVFKVTPANSAQLLNILSSEVQATGPGKSLANKVASAQAYYTASNLQAACESLAGLINEVTAQTGKKISVPAAAIIIADSRDTRTALGC
jgi:hypothetical protein